MGKNRTLEIIKTEIERLKAKYRKDMYKSNREGLASGYKIEAYNELLPFLSTLESEKPMNQEGLEEEIERCVIEPYYDLNGVAVKGATAYITVNDVADIARHFAEWGYLRAAEKYNEVEYNRQRAEESGSSEIPNALEEAAGEYAKTTFKRPYSDNPDEEVTIVEPDKYAGFIAGAKWQKSQMMKEGAEGEVRKDGTIGYFEFSNEQQFHSLLEKFQDCDKVRIIIVKE